jgi:hypothetical protein
MILPGAGNVHAQGEAVEWRREPGTTNLATRMVRATPGARGSPQPGKNCQLCLPVRSTEVVCPSFRVRQAKIGIHVASAALHLDTVNFFRSSFVSASAIFSLARPFLG